MIEGELASNYWLNILFTIIIIIAYVIYSMKK